MTFSAGLCAVALLGTAALVAVMPRVEHVWSEERVWEEGSIYRRLHFTVSGHRATRGNAPTPLNGELTADLFLKSGDVLTLEVSSPSLRYRIVDTAGRDAVPPSADGAFDESAVLRWMAAAGVDPANAHVRAGRRRLLADQPDAGPGSAGVAGTGRRSRQAARPFAARWPGRPIR